MKIIVGQNVYIQKFGLYYMLAEFHRKPTETLNLIFNTREMYEDMKERDISKIQMSIPFVMKGIDDAVSFSIKSTTPEAREHLEKLDYLLDFKEYYNLSIDELNRRGQALAEAHNDEVRRIQSLGRSCKAKAIGDILDSYDWHKLACLEIGMLVAIKEGEIAMPKLPAGFTL